MTAQVAVDNQCDRRVAIIIEGDEVSDPSIEGNVIRRGDAAHQRPSLGSTGLNFVISSTSTKALPGSSLTANSVDPLIDMMQGVSHAAKDGSPSLV
jgi:hypothetical protein